MCEFHVLQNFTFMFQLSKVASQRKLFNNLVLAKKYQYINNVLTYKYGNCFK